MYSTWQWNTVDGVLEVVKHAPCSKFLDSEARAFAGWREGRDQSRGVDLEEVTVAKIDIVSFSLSTE